MSDLDLVIRGGGTAAATLRADTCVREHDARGVLVLPTFRRRVRGAARPPA